MTKAQRWQLKPARTESDLEQLEAAYRILDLYIWLSFRMEAAFSGMHRSSVHADSYGRTLCNKYVGHLFCMDADPPKSPGPQSSKYAQLCCLGMQTCMSRDAQVTLERCSTPASRGRGQSKEERAAKRVLCPCRPGGSRKAEEAGGSPHRGGPAPPGTQQQNTDCEVRYVPLSLTPGACKGRMAFHDEDSDRGGGLTLMHMIP